MIDLLKELPSNIVERHVSLEKLGLLEVAWKIEEVPEILLLTTKKKYIIAGGDVYKWKDNLETTYDSWFFEKTYYSADDSKKSIEKAYEYIAAYVKKNGDSYAFSFVILPF